ncbi:MAG: HD domain-containing protein [Lachnospiraceae bacterium]|nr:HD domain-containing protein [Lachnospiraceae bacterium]
MKINPKQSNRYAIQLALAVLIGVAVDAGLSYLVNRFDLPLYVDTAGSITVAAVLGLFPGMITALLSNLICGFYNEYAAYYSIISIMISITASYFFRRGKIKKISNAIVFVLISAALGGGLGAVFQMGLLGHPQFPQVEEVVRAIVPSDGLLFMAVFILVNIGLNLVDKAVSTIIVVAILSAIPENEKRYIWASGWKQKPLTEEEVKTYSGKKGRGGISLQARLTALIIVAMVSVVAAMGVAGLRLFFNNMKQQYRADAVNASQFAANAVDADLLEGYVHSRSAIKLYTGAGYQKTNELLKEFQTSVGSIKYLYIYQIREDGRYVIFDTDEELQESGMIGEYIPFDASFEPYIPMLLAGEKIPTIENDDIYGYFITAYTPIYNSHGECVAYAGADASIDYISDYMRDFILRVGMIFSGFFALILAYGLRMSRVYMVYPIDSMASVTDSIADASTDQESMEAYVNELKALDIRTGDEVEKLYKALCRMARNTSEQMRGIRYFSNANLKMQNGLIITMADMVENRDSDTGAHIQKTAAYVRIILEGLKEKGYYAEKLTDKYMSDVEMSAPLHDVGKINIPDAVLNKPGKLTDEEFEIMKTHTTAGKHILENAISTFQGDNYLKEARNMAAYHHERWDGKGYPEGLHGQVIPLSARVMAVADVFDALTSPRVYKPAFPLEKALEIIREGAGTQFDPKCVEVFMDSLGEVKQVLKKYQET